MKAVKLFNERKYKQILIIHIRCTENSKRPSRTKMGLVGANTISQLKLRNREKALSNRVRKLIKTCNIKVLKWKKTCKKIEDKGKYNCGTFVSHGSNYSWSLLHSKLVLKKVSLCCSAIEGKSNFLRDKLITWKVEDNSHPAVSLIKRYFFVENRIFG